MIEGESGRGGQPQQEQNASREKKRISGDSKRDGQQTTFDYSTNNVTCVNQTPLMEAFVVLEEILFK